MAHRPGRSASFLVRPLAVDDGAGGRRPDRLLVEEPLLIRLNDQDLTSTMRTPGHDFELAVGFCLAEGALAGVEVADVRYCGTGSAAATEFNIVSVSTKGRPPEIRARLTGSTSSCGLCGHDALDDLTQRLAPLAPHDPWPPSVLLAGPDLVTGHQPLFAETGTTHVAAAIDRDSRVVVAREDIGRHNAVDKVVGRLVLDRRIPADDLVLFVSSRASFEIVQKAWAAGFTAVVAVSGPSALAVSAARSAGMTLVGFARRGRGNLYSPA